MFSLNRNSVPCLMMPGITRRTLAHGEKMMVCEFTLEEGATIPPHRHPHDQVGYIVSGRIRLTVGDATEELGAGDTYCAGSNVEHAVVALAASVVADTFCPPRVEYL